MPSGIVSGAGLNKDEVNYRQHEQCNSCVHFYHPNSCDVVDGNVSPETVCDKWEVKPRSNEGKDSEYYNTEYQKSQK